MEFKFTITTKEDMIEKCCKKERVQKTHDDVVACSDNIVAKLENGTGLKLKANTSSDKVNGYVGIYHGDTNHIITVSVTEVTEGRNERPTKMPTRNELQRLI